MIPDIYTYDTETCGLHGLPVTIQYARGMQDVNIHHIWFKPVGETLKLVEDMMRVGTMGFNIVFDQFHLCKLWTVFNLIKDKNIYPIDHIDMIGELEEHGRDGPCLKPKHSFDLMLYARKGPYQSTMNRDPITVKRVPRIIAEDLIQVLDSKLRLKDLYFAKSKDKARWKIKDIKNEEGEVDKVFCNLQLVFRASTGLKAIAQDALGIKATKFTELEHIASPTEYGFAPFATAIGKPGQWRDAWPDHIVNYATYWKTDIQALRYAADDVEYCRDLYSHWGYPDIDDVDSRLATMVAACRWRGYAVDIPYISQLKEEAQEKIKTAIAPNRVKEQFKEVMSPVEWLVFSKGSTKKVILEELATFTEDNPKVAALAQQVLDTRAAKKELEIWDKILLAGRFHASADIIGARSSRMSGSGGDLNSQGIKKTKTVRKGFPLAAFPFLLAGGDFESFEVTIADAAYNDPKLRADLLAGKSIHGIFGTFVYPNMTYEEIMATKGTSNDLYTRSKSAVFAMLYGGTAYTLKTRLGVEEEVAQEAYDHFVLEYPCVGKQRQKIIDDFCTMRQEGGIGSKITWKPAKDYVESLLGFKRYFTLENEIIKILYDLASDIPKSWKKYEGKVIRRDRVQRVDGAVRSAIYGCAFAIQTANARAAGNHVIQSAGAEITKHVEAEIWEEQPHGIHEFKVMPINIHDEIMCPTVIPSLVKERVDNCVEKYRNRIPLIGMDWRSDLKTWADK